MAHHQQTNHDRMHAVQGLSAAAGQCHPGIRHSTDEEELGSDTDEPPDRPIQFSKLLNSGSHSSASEQGYPLSPRYRKGSLLTQALTSPELLPLSDVEAPVLTSDGELTSPARTSTPSPPLPALSQANLSTLDSRGFLVAKQGQNPTHIPHTMGMDRTQEVKVEEGLGRRRCISFACTQTNSSQATGDTSVKETVATTKPATPTTVVPKRPCMLRFACPTKPSRTASRESSSTLQVERHSQGSPHPQKPNRSDSTAHVAAAAAPSVKPEVAEVHHDYGENPEALGLVSPSMGTQDRRLETFNRVNFQKSEATRFHEFAGSFTEEDEWTNEQTAFRQKITINDTLRKENAIRKLADEAEEEAQEEEEDTYGNAADDLDDASDGGNETDDEEGFADSDDESDGGSAYQFWTPGNTTAATSTDHMDHIRPVSYRAASESSIESVIGAKAQRDEPNRTAGTRARKISRSQKRSQNRPGSPDLPDSSDFVIGTIDEDQPLEDEYLSRLKQKERSKQKLIPQDIDPSFPTSDPEAENDDDEELEDDDESDQENEDKAREEPEWITGQPDSSDEEFSVGQRSSLGAKRPVPNASPRRLHSPPPPSRRLFGQAVHRLRSPPPIHRKLISPPSSRRQSLSGSPGRIQGIDITRLAQRPNLTHTTSLPRTPNPFWGMHRKSRFHGSETPSAGTSPKASYQTSLDTHSRGPIEIVQGLENKRQRRKEKFWRQHCQKLHAGKEKERKCQPGKGAQRMREVGLVMADRFKGYKQGTKLVLSV